CSSDLVKYYLPRYMRTWERVDTYEAGYLAGAFDADGCLQTVNGSGLQVQLSQYDNALLARARDCLETLGFQYTDRVVVNEWGKDQHIVTVVGGLPETLRFLGSVRPPRLLAKWMAFDVAQRRFWAREMFEVVSVTDGGEREIAEITSSAGTYISAGYGSHNTSFEWLMYCQLERHFRDDPRFRFMIPGEADAHFPVAGQRVMLTHGDSLGTRGGDGMIGPLGPITRGIIKTRNSEAQIGRDFDFCCMGHWHQWMPLHDRGFVVNGCFPPGQPVLLADAQEKPIEAVSVGDMVVTHTGNVRPVVDRMERNHHGEIVHFRVGTETSDVRCTPNHKVWAVKGSQTSLWLPVNGGWEKVGTGRPEPSWIPAEYLSIGDYISAPAPMESTPYGLGDAAFFRLIGLYVAEGSASGRDGRLDHLDFSLHRNEEAIADFIVEQCRRRWGSGEHVLPNGRPNSRSVACYRGAAATEMAALGGRGSKTKALSAAVMTAPPDLQVEVLLGWLAGDGHTAKASYRGGRYVSGTSVSRALIMQMRQIALRCGMRPHVYLLRAGGPRKSDSWTLGFMREDAERLGAQLDEPVTPSKRQIAHASIDVGGKAFYRITHVWRTDYDGPVHNLTVADDHSYVVNGWGVKNSLKGYDEFARLFLRARYERPIQGLWFMHPRVGVTSVWPIYLEPMPRHASVDPALPFAA
ncbi:MAG: LAGLIDADG family homing endonuclease, partial [Alphaproteobacteria bacterium]